MRNGTTIGVVIPALDEAQSIARVIDEIPGWVDHVVVADNGSRDGTGQIAADHGADVVTEPRDGYGAACQAGIRHLMRHGIEMIVFLDGDYSDNPGEMDRLVDPIIAGNADLVIGSRLLGDAEPGSLTLAQRFGNRLACALMRLFWGVRYSDLGPFRAIRADTLAGLHMRDRAFGWTVEMQVRAAQAGLVGSEQPVSYKPRIGQSKISGTVSGTFRAGTAILGTIFRSALRPSPLAVPALKPAHRQPASLPDRG